MILIAPDKYRGTLTGAEAAEVIAANCKDDKIIFPMADGGEGTAAVIASIYPGWEMIEPGIYENERMGRAAIDSASRIGLHSAMAQSRPLDRSSSWLATAIVDLYKRLSDSRPVDKIYIGIGGTGVCDGGLGFIEGMNCGIDWSNILVGLADVEVPLLPQDGSSLSALSFCPQKGYSEEDTQEVAKRLKSVQKVYGPARSRFAGAGGGMGYALADVLKVPVYSGARWLLQSAPIPWEKITTAITGEGKYDRQTSAGKVVAALAEKARQLGIPAICLAGCVEQGAVAVEGVTVIDVSSYPPHEILSKEVARQRLANSAKALRI